jgi:adenylate cyclase
MPDVTQQQATSAPSALPREQSGLQRLLASLGSGLAWLAELGTDGYPPDVVRRLKIVNMIAYLIAISTLIYAVQHSFLNYDKYRPVILINYSIVALAFIVPLSHRISEIAGGLTIVAVQYLAQLSFAAYLGSSTGVQLHFFVAAAAPFVVLGLKRMWLILPIIAAALALHLYCWFAFPISEAIIDADASMVNSIYVQAAVTTFALIGASVYYAFSLAETAKAETDALLRNILPGSIVERLQARPSETIADTFPEASILFADISGFVPLARSLGAERTVSLLNRLVTEFDLLAQRHGVEKIKTIGDAYMAASGLPEPKPRHTERLAAMAIDMQLALERLRQELKLDLNMRIGLASGPVMAGVIGKQKFSYDVWGDAVNLAARLEGLSQPGRILVCQRTQSLLDGVFTFENHGEVQVKGIGAMPSWFLGSARL